MFSLQKFEVDQAIGIIFRPEILAIATGPLLHSNAGPLGPSGVIPILIPFFVFLIRPIIPPTAFQLVEPHTV